MTGFPADRPQAISIIDRDDWRLVPAAAGVSLNPDSLFRYIERIVKLYRQQHGHRWPRDR
jgi:hypothetical protein